MTMTPQSGGRRPVVAIHGSRKAQRVLGRILGALQRPVHVHEGFAPARAALEARPEMVFVEHSLFLSPEGQAFLGEAARAGVRSCVVLLGREASALDVGRLFQTSALTNLVLETDEPSLAENLIVTSLKVLRNDIFGLDKYLAWGVEPVRCTLERASERRALVARLYEDVLEQGWGARWGSMAALVADELLSNAVFHAPVDAAGRHVRSGLARTEELVLAGRERVELRYACDGRFLAIAVEDGFGSVDRARIVEFLSQQATGTVTPREGGGAGMGLALVYGCVSQLVINLEVGRRTEVIGLLDVRGELPPRAPGASALNIFIRDTGEVGA